MLNRKTFLATVAALALAGCNSTTLGGGSSGATGSAGAAGSQNAAAELTRCARPLGVAALVEEPNQALASANLPSPVPMLKLMMGQSGCFQIVDRGAASEVLMRERELMNQGQLQGGSQMGAGQMVAADFLISPQVIFQDQNAGGGAGALGAFLPGIAGVVAGGLSVQNLEAQTLLTLVNTRSGVQEAVAEGSAKKRDIGFGGLGFGGGIGGAMGAYESTDIGKIVVAAFLDAHNNLVSQMGAMQAQDRPQAWQTTASVNFRAGPSTDDAVIGNLPTGTTVYPTGREAGTWWEIEAIGQTGWVSSNYLRN